MSFLVSLPGLAGGGCGSAPDPRPAGAQGPEASSTGRSSAGSPSAPTTCRARRILDPPLRQAWSINTHALIEFPPAIADGVAYVVNKFGNAKAVRLSDRKIIWERNDRPERLRHADRRHRARSSTTGTSSSPTSTAGWSPSTRRPASRSGRATCTPTSNPRRSSVGNRLYLGDDKTNVVAVRASDGRVLWQFNSPGAIKASPSYHDGRVYVADYEGAMFCLDATTGKLVWRTNTTKVPPFGKGGFYSSPAIAFGRVYAARDDGTVFAFDLDERQGRLVVPDRQLRLRLAGGGQGPGDAADGLHRLLRRAPLRARRAQRQGSGGTTTSAARCRARRP